ncbi:YdcF family protein [Microbacter margulisiae]|uniref:DUF218 domain-containing protein n=1 Tax=Microbacter margulisiae TaxID=1350067 RepID=A0A7W5DSM2_9PORP|nr:YdcF family protein [Microbacter margulisiae]MBB3188336.1 hypothetical protein [Microbacter margulisiae]
MKKLLSIVFLLTATLIYAYAQVVPGYKLLAPASVETKNYYFVSLLEHLPAARKLITNDPVLCAISKEKQQKLAAATTSAEIIAAFKFSPEEIDDIGNRLAALYTPGTILDSMIQRHILPSGCYILLAKKFQGKSLLKAIWDQDANGMNYAIDVYAAAKRPEYASIDSISFNVHSAYYTQGILPACQQNIEAIVSGNNAFFAVPLTAVQTILDFNDRDLAIDYEPLGKGVNQKSYAKIMHTNWAKYSYTAILVLGAGPETLNTEISPFGRLRAAYGALLYKKHLAPFIIVSGGKVHPYHTPYCEAYEMKKYLMKRWGIPEDAIIMEPHARHTNTNVRNTVRIMIRKGFPLDRPALMTSSESHINYIKDQGMFAKRCETDLNMVPYRLGKRVSKRAIEFYPQEVALQINPFEPLDP